MAKEKPSSTKPTLADIKRANAEAGGHWFEPGAMKFFNSRIESGIYAGKGGMYFVTSETPKEEEPRRFSVRVAVNGGKKIDTVGDFQAYSTRDAAREAAKRLAAGRPGSPTARKATEVAAPKKAAAAKPPKAKAARPAAPKKAPTKKAKRRKAHAAARKAAPTTATPKAAPLKKPKKAVKRKVHATPKPAPAGNVDTAAERRAAGALREMVAALNRAEQVGTCEEVWAALLEANRHRMAARSHLLSIPQSLATRAGNLVKTLNEADVRAAGIVELMGWCKSGAGAAR